METVSVKFRESFLHDMEKTMKRHRYATKAEFIREAVRQKIKDLEKEEALLRLKKVAGSSTRRITDEDLKRAREEAFVDIEKRFK